MGLNPTLTSGVHRRSPAPPPTGPSRLDGARGTGRAEFRPHAGPGPATQPTFTPGARMPGFPVPPRAPATGDGSGLHAARSPGWRDHVVEQSVWRMADAADGLGLNNAARHLRHYLTNTGEALTIDPAAMLAQLPSARQKVDAAFQTNVVDTATAKVAAEYKGRPMSFTITTPWTSAYAYKSESRDWFFAVGGFSASHTAVVTVTPGADGAARVHIDSALRVFDRYNWDGGKSVDIGPIHVEDTAMGRLHTVGLAQEFQVRGTSALPPVDVTVR